MNSLHRFPRRLRAAAVALVAATAASGAAAHAVRIDLCATAATPTARVTLADIASIKADDATAARLGALEVGQVSADGQPTLVDRATLTHWIQARTGLMSQDIAWSGAERCSVHVDQAGATHPPLAPAVAATTTLARASLSGVTRGNVATLRSSSGGIRVESRVEVLQDGAVGQDVRVRLPGAVDAVLARVVAPGQVEVAQ